MSNTPLTLGTFGLGCVGQGFLQLLDANGGRAAQVKHICVKDRGRPRDPQRANLTYQALDILTDTEVNTIVELTNDPVLALEVIGHALVSGRNAITAGKKVVAENLAELIELQRNTGRSLLYEASCAASIPVLHLLETHFSGEQVQRIEGILNGTTNYILTKVEEGLPPSEALRQAQAEGFAETDPTSDLNGDDARYKLCILIAHAFGAVLHPRAILRHGIQHLEEQDIAFGRSCGWTVRSIATACVAEGRLVAHVLPTFVRSNEAFAQVRDEYNAVRITGDHTGTHFLQGKGAGRLPTGLAVLSDVQRLVRGGGYTYARVGPDAPVPGGGDERLHVYARLPVTHQELLAHFSSLRVLGGGGGSVRITGHITLHDLAALIGEDRDGFQVIVLPSHNA